MPEDLQQITLAATENVQVAGMGITSKTMLNLQGQRPHALAHVGSPGGDPHRCAARNRDHRDSARNAVISNAGDMLFATRTVASPISITIARGSASDLIGAPGLIITAAKPRGFTPAAPQSRRRHL